MPSLHRFASLLVLAVWTPAQHIWHPHVSSNQDPSYIPDPGILERRIAVAGDVVHAAWTVGDPDQRVQWARSLDGGASWSRESILSPRGMREASCLQLIAHGSHVLVAWSDGWQNASVYIASSNDLGQTWRTQKLRTMPDGCTKMLGEDGTIVALSGTSLFVSTDDGATWSGPRALAQAGQNMGAIEGNVSLQLQGGRLHAAWAERAGTTHAFCSSSDDLGLTWQADRLMASNPQQWSQPIDIVGAGSVVLVFWREANGYHIDRSLDGGATWQASPTAVPGISSLVAARLVFDGRDAIVAWDAGPSSNHFTASYLRSTDLGLTWPGPPTVLVSRQYAGRFGRMTDNFGSRGLMLLSFTYLERQYLPYTAYSITLISTDGGSHWSGANGIASSNCRYGLGSAPMYCTEGGALHAIWSEYPYSVGPLSVSVDWLAGPRSLGGSASGTGGVAPRLLVDRVPVLGSDCELSLVQGRAGAPAVVSFGPRSLPTPFLGGQLTVTPLACHFVLLGTSGASNGAASLRLHLPMNGLLSQFTCQAFVLDQAAPHGVAMSAGAEIRAF